jgi:hypothetical protein
MGDIHQGGVMMTMPTVEDMLKGMPHSQRGRGRTLYNRGRDESSLKAAGEVEQILSLGADDRETLTTIRSWVTATREAVAAEEAEHG